ncbi:NAD+ synthase [Haloparvum alkalitolerans]|uniref:NAD+ synthase n=1 Tax=Haloparvum alkalitolerans TaxID=1042953 RepID=UPI003CF0CE19
MTRDTAHAIDFDDARGTIGSFLRETLAEADADGYVLGVSGGLDSALAAHLAAGALGPDRVLGLVMPGAPSAERHMRDAREVCDALGIDRVEVDIEPIVEATLADVPAEDRDRVTVGNVRARERMLLSYREANRRNLLVLGANNRSERLLGYFTKYGDGGVDVAALGDCYKTEVYAFARAVGVDERIVGKTPTAELWEGQTDEGELGESYETIDRILRAIVDRGLSVPETAERTDIDEATVREFADMWRGSAHKRAAPPTPGVERRNP